jgi:malonyl-CoA O-methyltransferase
MTLDMLLDRLINRLNNRVTTLHPRLAYQAWAKTYDQRENNALLNAEERTFVPLLESVQVEGKNVIDFGCGTGRHLFRCCGKNAHSIVGVDFSHEMLMYALRKSLSTEQIILLESSVESLPFHDAQFDVGISTLVLSHCPSLSVPVAEMARVLRPGATLLVSDWHPENDRRGWKRIFDVPSADGKKSRYAAKSYRHSLQEYREQFAKHGFVVEQLQEPVIDKSLEPMFQRTNMMKVFHQYSGCPIAVVFALRKG